MPEDNQPTPPPDRPIEAPRPSGLLVVDKPEGPSSMAAVAAVRRRFRAFGKVKVGHGGTLDPLASGVRGLGVGSATRVRERVVAADKRYRTAVDLSAFTTTDDREGVRTELAVDTPPSEASVREALSSFSGIVQQRPPAFSAIKVNGRRSYRLARDGAPPELPARPVRIDEVRLVSYRWPIAELDIRCGKGVYVRSIARDLGCLLGVGGHCAWLRRTAVGIYDESLARPLDELPETLGPEDLLATPDSRASRAADRSAR
ncbi:MAG: tRNA pseudouridine(55) synthase TruB [Phycisphaerales bacterium]